MASINSSKNKLEFGDFQTPTELAELICEVIKEKYNYSPDCIIEPTCGKGNLMPRKAVIITQKRIGENTNYIQEKFPKTWNYLNENLESFMNRKSSIYKNKPLFSIFSIGEYSFYPYKIAISGLYKNIKFNVLEPFLNKSIQVDDTCNFISCKNLEEAEILYKILNSSITTEILNSLIFWDSKRPITTEILNKIDLKKVAEELNFSYEYEKFVLKNPNNKVVKENLMLF